MDPELSIRDRLPPGILELEATELHTLLDGPTLFCLPGRSDPPLFVSALLHGNEDTGWLAVREVLRARRASGLPRSLWLFVGNVQAARAGRRRLDDQPDFNRIWAAGDRAEHLMAARLLGLLRAQPPFAAVDIHNNTGRNPHYACINRLDSDFLTLAEEFSSTIVYFRKPDTVISLALSEIAPAVTLECGQPGDPGGIRHAAAYLEKLLALSSIPPVTRREELRLFHTTATVRVPADLSFGFGGTGNDLDFVPDLDAYNFREIPPGTMLARTNSPEARLEAEDEDGNDVAARYFVRANNRLTMGTTAMLSMLTLEERIIRQDCLCYLMERYPLPAPDPV